MDSLTNRITELDTNQENLSSADLHLENLRRRVKSDPDDVFAACPGVKSLDEWGHTAIHRALDEGSVELLASLLNRKAATDIPDKYGFYAVHKAVEAGSVEQLQLLKRAGAPMCIEVGPDAELEAHDQHGWLGATALHWAVRDGHLEMLKLFLAFGVDPCARMWDDSTAMHIAADPIHPEGPGDPGDYEDLVKGRELCLKLLLDRAPKSVEMHDNLGRTPFHRALATMAPYEIRRFFFHIRAPLGRQIGKSCYVATVELDYYHGRGEWDDDESKKYDLVSRHNLIRELKDEGIEVREVSDDGDILHVKVDYQLWRPRCARL